MKKVFKSLIKLVFVVLIPLTCMLSLIYIMMYPAEVTTLITVAVTMVTTLSIFLAIAMWNISPNVYMLPHVTYQAVPILTLGIGLHPVTMRSIIIFLPLVTIEIGAKRKTYIRKL
jgi:hypothetical protein